MMMKFEDYHDALDDAKEARGQTDYFNDETGELDRQLIDCHLRKYGQKDVLTSAGP